MTDYISPADTAKLIRVQLKAKFPGIKFSVKTSVYSGGASIDVVWTDGPTAKMVDAVVKPFGGGGFDGMIDLAYSVYAYLLPDGSAVFAQTSGTEGSGGVHPADKQFMPVAGAKRVHFGANYIFTSRKKSRAFLERALLSFNAKYGDQGAEIKDQFDGSAYAVFPPTTDQFYQHAWQEAIGKRVATGVTLAA